MIIQPISYNGTSILTNTSTDFRTDIPRASALLQGQVNLSYVRRAGAEPVFSGKEFQPVTLNLEIEAIHDFMTVFETLNQVFDVHDETPRQLIIQDTEDSNKQYYAYATPKQVQGGHDGAMAVVTLGLDDPIWQSVTQNSQTFATTAASDSTSVIAAGNADSYPIFEITPSSIPAADYIYNMYCQVLPTSTDPWSGRFLDITGSTDGTTWDTAALITGLKMQASSDPGGAGGDIRVIRDGVYVDYWLDGINTTDTHVIVVADMPRAANMTLKTAIASTDTITEVELKYTTANKAAINTLPGSGRLILDTSLGSTDTEEFTYTAKTVTATKLAFTINARSVRNTSAFSFAVGANVRFLPYDFNIVYGNLTTAAQTMDDTYKPMPALTSRNNSFSYINFNDESGLRANSINPYIRKVASAQFSRSDFYTSTNDEGDTDPSSAMGLAAYTYEAAGVWKSDSVTLAWLGYYPDKIASIAASGEQNQSGATSVVYSLRASPNTETFPLLWNVSAQSSSDYSTWTTWSKSSSDATIPTNSRYLLWRALGTIGGSIDKSNRVGITSLTVGLTNCPHVMMRTESSNYKLDCTIGNSTTGESFTVNYPMQINNTLYIDTDPNFPTAKYKGQIINGAVTLSTIRSAWLKLSPGTNTITYVTNNAGASDISIAIKWRDRMNFL